MSLRNAVAIIAAFAALSLFAAGAGYGQPEVATGEAGEAGAGMNVSAPQQAAAQQAAAQQTQNVGAEQQLMIRNWEQNQAGQYRFTLGDGNQAELGRDGNGVRLRVRDREANCSLNITPVQEQNRTRLNARLSNGRNAEIRVMPGTASETALARLRVRNCNETNGCTIQLKEVGSGNQTRAAYAVQVEKRARLLGLFDVTMPVEAEVDAENGELVRTGRPWWAFLAAEQDE